MTQDTRKDKRARDINVVVRYKSATVDEFIENHSFDISRGGAFIKTNNPFPPGTLLKFELRLAANEKVVSGVGRVVWKREQAHATSENPAGMGVKFIKIDDASKTVIDNMVAQNPSAGGAFEAVSPMPSTPPPSAEGKAPSLPRPAPPAPPQRASRTIAGMPTPVPELGARTGLSPKPGKVADDASAENDLLAALEEGPRKTEPQRSTFASRRATMMGIGVSSSPPPAPTPEPPPAAPDATAPGARPEPTVMKQAAELLAEALKEAGGSMEEIEGNPLFENLAKNGDGGTSAEERGTPPSLRIANEGGEEDLPTRVVPSSNLGDAAAVDPSGATEPMPKQGGNQQSGDTVAFQRSAKTGPPAGLPPLDIGAAKPVQATPKAAPAEKKGGGGAFLAIGVLLLLGGGAFYAWKTGMFGGSATLPPNTPSVTIPAETAKAAPSTPATVQPSAEPTASSAPAPSASASAAPSASVAATASAAPTAAVTAPATAKPAPPPGVPVAPVPVMTAKPPAPKNPEGDPAAPTAAAPTAAAPKPTAAAPTAAPTAAPAPPPTPVAAPDELK